MTEARKAVIYCRISLDSQGDSAGVRRQEEDCRDLASRNGWRVVEVITDNSVSAYSGKARPGFAAVLAAIREGRADTVVCWHLDRLARRGADLAALLDLRAECPDLAVVPVRGTAIYAADPSGRMTAEILTSVSGFESAHRAERVARQRRQEAESGRLPQRCYGYDPATSQPQEPAATAVRAAFSAFLEAQTITAAQAALTAADPTAAASRNAVRGLLTRAAYAGVVTYRGAERPDVAASWPPLVSVADFRRTQAILSRPARRFNKHNRGARHRLLSGLVICGRCSSPMQASTTAGWGTSPRRRVYACDQGGEHLRRSAQPVEAFAVALAMARLGLPDAQATVLPRDPAPGAASLAAQWADLRTRRSAVADALATGLMDAGDYQRVAASLAADLAAVEDRLAAAQVEPATGAPLPADPAYALVGLGLGGLRAVIDTLASITLLPVRPGRRPFSRESVRVAWRTALPAEPAQTLAAAGRPPEEWWEEIQALVDGGVAAEAEAYVSENPPPPLSQDQRRALWAALTPAAATAPDAELPD